MTNVVEFARQIIAMQNRIDDLNEEVFRLRSIEEQYHELLDSSLSHSKQMVGGLLALALQPGVMEACQKKAKAGK